MDITMDAPTSYRNHEIADTEPINYREAIEENLHREISDCQGTVGDICTHILTAGGKRVRPLLAWYSGMMFGPASVELMKTAVAAELIHMASLIHDDLIDGSAIRRNQPAVHKIWGSHQGVLGGDYLFAKAFGTLAECRSTLPLKIMAETVQNMCQGEIDQDSDQYNLETSLEKYYGRITQKTAVLLAASCKIGAAVCGATNEQMEAIGRFGLNLGLAYQMVDDILDICGDQLTMGKPKYTDIIRGNITLPLILLRRKAEYAWVTPLLIPGKITEEVLLKIEAAVRSSGSMETALALAVSHLDTARTILHEFPDSPERNFLTQLTDKLQARTS